MTVFIGVDVGSRFTDFSVSLPDEKREIVHRVLLTPADPDRAIVAGLREFIARLGIARVIIPPNPGILCAEGLLNSDLVADFVPTGLAPFAATSLARINRVGSALTAQAKEWFEREQVASADRRATWSIDLRNAGQNFELSIPCSAPPLAATDLDDIAGRFHTAHEQAYGFEQEGEPIEFVSLRVKLIGILEKLELAPRAPGKPIDTCRVAFAKDAWRDAPVYRRQDLAPGQQLDGPTIIEQMDCTTPLFPSDRLRLDDWDNLVVELAKGT